MQKLGNCLYTEMFSDSRSICLNSSLQNLCKTSCQICISCVVTSQSCSDRKTRKGPKFFTKRLSGLSKMTYAARLQYLELQSLERRCLNQDLIMCYKNCLWNGWCKFIRLFTLSGSSITRGHCYKISFHHCRVNARLNFFSNRVIAVWNSLPETVVTAPTIDILKFLLMKLELPIVWLY